MLAFITKKVSHFVEVYSADPIAIRGSKWIYVKFGPMVGVAFSVGITLALLAALSIYGPGNTYQFFVYNFLFFPFVMLFFSIFGIKVFNPFYWVRTIKEMKTGTWTRPPAKFFGGSFPILLLVLYLGSIFDVSFFTFMDLMAPILMLILSFSRLACLNYGCCYGHVMKKETSLFVKYDHYYSYANRIDPENFGKPRIPTQFIEFASGLLLSIPVILAFIYGNNVGLPSALFFISQGLIRFFTDFMRYTEEPKFLNITVRQWASLGFIIIGIVTLFYMSPQPPLIFSPLHTATALKTIPIIMILGFLQFSIVFGLHTEDQNEKDYNKKASS